MKATKQYIFPSFLLTVLLFISYFILSSLGVPLGIFEYFGMSLFAIGYMEGGNALFLAFSTYFLIVWGIVFLIYSFYKRRKPA